MGGENGLATFHPPFLNFVKAPIALWRGTLHFLARWYNHNARKMKTWFKGDVHIVLDR